MKPIYFVHLEETSDRMRRNPRLQTFQQRAVRIGKHDFKVNSTVSRTSMKEAFKEQCDLLDEVKSMARIPERVTVYCVQGPLRGIRI